MAYNPDPRLVQAIRSRGGNLAPILLATALVESGGRLDAVGDGGRSHGPFQEYDLGRGAGIPIAQRRDPVAATERALREFQTFYSRGARGADLAYRAQRPADRAGYIQKIKSVLPTAQQILGQAGGAAQTAGLQQDFSAPIQSPRQVAGRPSIAPPVQAPLVLSPKLQRQIQTYLRRSAQEVEQGITPTSPMHIVSAIAKAQQRARQTAAAFDAPAPQGPRVMSLQGGNIDYSTAHAGHNHGEVDLSKFPTGSVDSGKVYRGGDGGDWGGSLPLALKVAQISGLPVSSQKRSRQRTASGGISDHWVGSTRSYAVDLATSGKAGDAAYVKVLRGLGLDPSRHRAGQWHNVNIGGYRYQIGWRTPGHFDHIHVGVQKL